MTSTRGIASSILRVDRLFFVFLGRILNCNIARFCYFFRINRAFLLLSLLCLTMARRAVNDYIFHVRLGNFIRNFCHFFQLICPRVCTSFFCPMFYILQLRFGNLISIVSNLLRRTTLRFHLFAGGVRIEQCLARRNVIRRVMICRYFTRLLIFHFRTNAFMRVEDHFFSMKEVMFHRNAIRRNGNFLL